MSPTGYPGYPTPLQLTRPPSLGSRQDGSNEGRPINLSRGNQKNFRNRARSSKFPFSRILPIA